MHNQVLSKYHDVMGFGLNQFQFLWTTVNEIARENNVDPKEACTDNIRHHVSIFQIYINIFRRSSVFQTIFITRTEQRHNNDRYLLESKTPPYCRLGLAG
jgi:hypothetical protein